jgi:hypothetical protein
VSSIDEALARAEEAMNELKPREAALYWALIAQTQVLRELQDELRGGTGKFPGGRTARASRRGLRRIMHFRLKPKRIKQTAVPT